MRQRRLFSMMAMLGLILFNCTELEIPPKNKIQSDMLPEGVMQAMDAISAPDVIDFETLARGTMVTTVNSRNGVGPVKVSAVNPLFPGRNAAMIFDSSLPTGQDPDLGTPNKDFAGPGVGVGGKRGSPYVNNSAIGKVLIVTEDLDSTDPNDSDLKGTYFTLDFSVLPEVTIHNMHILDVEAEESSSTVKFYNKTGAMIGTQWLLPRTGDNGINFYKFGDGVAAVAKMVVMINGSGAIDNIVFTTNMDEEPPTPGNCVYDHKFWKKHSKHDAWKKIGEDGRKSSFFRSDRSYYEVIKKDTKGNVYYVLAHQYISAKLNMLKGASAPDNIKKAMIECEKLFKIYTPRDMSNSPGDLSKKFIDYGTLLTKYNNGETGPGKCKEKDQKEDCDDDNGGCNDDNDDDDSGDDDDDDDDDDD